MIVHCIVLDKFIPPFINFVKKHFQNDEHQFVFLHGEIYEYGLEPDKQNIWFTDFQTIPEFVNYLKNADKIIIHGLWSDFFMDILYKNAFLLKKSYWIMWGGDFYFPEKQSDKKKKIIKKMGNLITDVKSDYELAKKWYGAKGKLHRCFGYPSNLYKDYEIGKKYTSSINILLGNSADPTNNHVEILERLEKYKDKNIKIYTPLSYGNQNYADFVIEKGKNIFGEKFIPLKEFLPYDEYLKLLTEIDIAIFNHNRQQAMGNIIVLLGLGKKVYIRDDVTSWNYFKDLQIAVFNINEKINLKPLDISISKENIFKIKNYFNEENLKNQWEKIFME